MKIIIKESQLSILLEQIDNNKIKSELSKVINYYKKWFSDPATIKKFRNPKNVNKVLSYIPQIKIKSWNKNNSPKNDGTTFGWVNPNVEKIVNLNLWLLTNGTKLYDTILHETGHLIGVYIEKLGEKDISTSIQGYYTPQGGLDQYVASSEETYTRIQRLRSIFGIGPKENTQSLVNKIVEAIKQKKLTFGNYKIGKTSDNKFLIFIKEKNDKGMLSDLWTFFSVAKMNNTVIPDISALFANYSVVKDNKVYTNLSKIAEINYNTKAINPQEL